MSGAFPSYLQLERLVLTCPLGLRFYDSATRTFVSDGLRVEASFPGDLKAEDSHRRVSAVVNRSRAFAFHHLPGLREFESGTSEEHYGTSPPAPRRYQIRVTDESGCFVPLSFTVGAPEWVAPASSEAASPPQAAVRTVGLYSAPARPVPGGCAVVRADLLEWGTERPAAWAMVEVSTLVRGDFVRALGVADPAGRLAVVFPYPETVEMLGSPVDGPRILAEQGWTLTFRAWHLFDAEPADAADLDRLLALAERPATDLLWLRSSPPQPFHTAELCFGRELVVPATGLGESRQLFISPAVSPP